MTCVESGAVWVCDLVLLRGAVTDWVLGIPKQCLKSVWSFEIML